MFKSIQYINYIEYNSKTTLHSYLFKITDDDFEEKIRGNAQVLAEYPLDAAVAGVIITCYENKNLNVPNNLLKLFMFYEKEYRTEFYSIQNQISRCIKYQPLFLKYKNEIEKYLSLV